MYNYADFLGKSKDLNMAIWRIKTCFQKLYHLTRSISILLLFGRKIGNFSVKNI